MGKRLLEAFAIILVTSLTFNLSAGEPDKIELAIRRGLDFIARGQNENGTAAGRHGAGQQTDL